MRKILMLGGSTSQVVAIKKAKEMGLYVILCDYLKDNPGQCVADEFYEVSTTDMESVLAIARERQVDAVVCYASDPAAPTAAYVCEKLGLPTSPYASVRILSHKDEFRKYLKDHGFNTPSAKAFTTLEGCRSEICNFHFPVMVKPVDSSGSKGINKIYREDELESAWHDAWQYTRAKRVLVEEYIEKKGYQISGDGFGVDGILKFRCFGNEFYSENGIKGYVPLGECWPSVLSREVQEKVHNELQRLITSLGMKTNAYNIEAIMDQYDNVYIMELGARNGGSLIPQITQMATGVDMVEYTIKAALGEDCSDLEMREPEGFYSNYMVHSLKSGKYVRTDLAEEIKENLILFSTDYKEGDSVKRFENSGHAIGEMVFKFDTMEEMMYKVDKLTEWVKVIVTE